MKIIIFMFVIFYNSLVLAQIDEKDFTHKQDLSIPHSDEKGKQVLHAQTRDRLYNRNPEAVKFVETHLGQSQIREKNALFGKGGYITYLILLQL